MKLFSFAPTSPVLQEGEHSLTCICAWCLAEQGETPCDADSHGICATHAQTLIEQSRARRALKQEEDHATR